MHDREGAQHVLYPGTDLASGDMPVVSVPVNFWQAAENPEDTPFAFGANVFGRAFPYEEIAIARREELLRETPDHADLMLWLTIEN